MKNSSPKVVMPGIKIAEREQDVAVHTSAEKIVGEFRRSRAPLRPANLDESFLGSVALCIVWRAALGKFIEN